MTNAEPYEPATSFSSFVEMFPYREVPSVGSTGYTKMLLEPQKFSDDVKYEILKHLSATYMPQQLDEYRDLPSEWFNTMFNHVLPWGVNGNLVESFCNNLIQMAENNTNELFTLFNTRNEIADLEKISKSVSNILESVKEDIPFSARESKDSRLEFIVFGFRHSWADYMLEEDSFYNLKVAGTALGKVLTSYDCLAIAQVVVALAFIDRMGIPGSSYTREDYINITRGWETLTSFEPEQNTKTLSEF